MRISSQVQKNLNNEAPYLTTPTEGNNLPDLDASTVLSETALESHNSECASAIISLSPSTHQLSPISVKDQLFHSLSPIHDITNGNISILRVSSSVIEKILQY